MLKEAYSLIMEVLNDEQLNEYIQKNTGKKLTIINAGAQVTTPSAIVTLSNGEYTRASNTKQDTGFLISFNLPFWGTDAFDKCLDFLDFAIPIFFDYRTKQNFIKSISPSVVEQDSERKFWIININVIVEVFI